MSSNTGCDSPAYSDGSDDFFDNPLKHLRKRMANREEMTVISSKSSNSSDFFYSLIYLNLFFFLNFICN